MRKISNVDILLDDNIPEYMEGIIRIGSVNIGYEDEEETDDCYDDEYLPDLVDNTEFQTEDQIIVYVAKKLNISRDLIQVIE